MKDVFAKLAQDFFSTIVFLAVYLITDNVVLATGVAIAGAVAQVIYARFKGEPLGFMTYASLALVIVLGSATLLTNGMVLLAGGFDANSANLASAELYQPPTLTPPGLLSISVSPVTASIPAGAAQQFIATGTFSGNTTQTLSSVTWISSNTTVAAISNDSGNHGLAVSASTGTTTISAKAGSISGSENGRSDKTGVTANSCTVRS